MKTLYESILTNTDIKVSNAKKTLDRGIKTEIKNFIKENYLCNYGKFCNYEILPDDEMFVVNVNGTVTVRNRSLKTLTNGMFVFGRCKGNFDCSYCESLTSLDGAPKEVGGDFDCSDCGALTSLDGAPEKVGGSFYCSYCDSLKSLQGAPEKVGRSFYCSDCGALTSLEGAPKEVGRDFNCRDCKIRFTKEDVEKESKVKGEIFV